MEPYHKIQTVFLRDPETKYKTLLEGQFAHPEFEYLANNEWAWTEKVDGTNIRVAWETVPTRHSDGTTSDLEPPVVRIGGRTDRAQIPALLLDRLYRTFTREKMVVQFGEGERAGVTLYGEGYGPGIQKGGGLYRTYSGGPDFILFDAKIGDVWLERDSLVDISNNLDISLVPIIGTGTLLEAVEFVRDGFESSIGDKQAEGFVCRPDVGLASRTGRRIITKIKCKDFS